MIISVKWNDKNSTFKIGEYTFKEIEANLCFAIFGENSKWPPFWGRGKFFENYKEYIA